MVKPNPQCDGIRRWNLWEVMGHDSGALMNGIIAFVKEDLKSPPVSSAIQGRKEKTTIYELENGFSPELNLMAP